MSDVHHKMHLRTRKDHRCAYCNATIPNGSVVLCEHGVWDHEPYRRYACGECEPNVDAFWEWTNHECLNPINESFWYFMTQLGEGGAE